MSAGPVRGRRPERGRAERGATLAPTFTVAPAMLDGLVPPVEPAGLVLGADPRGRPVSVALLRPAPTRVVVLGGLYLAHQVTVRALASGARVVVATGRPPAWEAVHRAAGDPERMTVGGDPPADAPHGTAEEPVLTVHDRGATTRGPGSVRGPWQTTMTVLPTLVPAVADLADDADLVLLTRMPPHEAELATRLWRLSASMSETLRTLPEHGVVALGRNLWQRLDLVTAPRETALIGPVRRGD